MTHRNLAKPCDVTLIVDGHYYPAHKSILRKDSPFFEKMFSVELKKQCNDEIVIEGICREVFDIILRLIYLRKVTVNNEILYSVTEAADYLGIVYRMRRIWPNCIE